MPRLLRKDIDSILEGAGACWPALKGGRLFFTGGTGFIGSWMLESLAEANERLDLGATVVVLSRDAHSFAGRHPHLSGNPSVRCVEGDVRTFRYAEGEFTGVIHAATDASARMNREAPLEMFDTILEGTRRTLEFAARFQRIPFLFLSSGAVYGEQPADLAAIDEDYAGGPQTGEAASAYGEAKRAAETLCSIYLAAAGVRPRIARCFAFVGPRLPLRGDYAIGNFIADAHVGQTIRLTGNGSQIRSYLYAADLTTWLWTILVHGKDGRAYNVGSEMGMRLADVAALVTRVAGSGHPPEILDQAPSAGRQRYVPATARAQGELGLRETVDIDEGVRRTLEWLGPA